VNELVLFARNTLATQINAAGDGARLRFLEFFTANGMIRRRHRDFGRQPHVSSYGHHGLS
jgi:hypothetical protein